MLAARVAMPVRKLYARHAIVYALPVHGMCSSEFPLLLCWAQVLVLTHEQASREEWLPYAAHALAPCRPMVCFGRSAALDLPVAAKEAVRDFWEDCRAKLVIPLHVVSVACCRSR